MSKSAIPAIVIIFNYQNHNFRFVFQEPPTLFQIVDTVYLRLTEVIETELPAVELIEAALVKILNKEE